MVFQNNLLMGAGGQSAEDYTIDYSCLFNDDDTAYLQWATTNTPTSTDIGTISVWLKRGNLGITNTRVWNKGDSGTPMLELIFMNTDKLMINGDLLQSISTQTFSDPSAWYNIVVAVDTSQGVAANRIKIYVNGTQITAWDAEDWPDQNDDIFIGTDWWMGRWSNDTTNNWDGYLSEVVYADGTAYAASDFGETNSTTGQWVPKDPSGLTFGTNGFYLDFADSTFLGKDASATSAAVTNKASTSSEWGGTTGAYTFATNEIDRSSTVNAIISTDLLSGDFNFNFTLTTSGGAVRIGVFDNQESNTFDGTSDDGGLDSMTNSWYLDMGNEQFRYGGASQGSASGVANGSAITIQRTGSTIKITDDGSDAHTFSQTFSNPVRVIISGGGAAFALDSVQYTADEASGNDNSFFSSGLAAADQTPDSPTLNRAVLNGIQDGSSATAVMSEGNTRVAVSGSTRIQRMSTIPLMGKVYWEVAVADNSQNIAGICDNTVFPMEYNDFQELLPPHVMVYDNANLWYNDSYDTYSQPSNGQRWMFAYDADTGELWGGVNGTWHNSGDPAAGTGEVGTVGTTTTWFIVIGGKSGADQQLILGSDNMSHTVPSGFTADLNVSQLDDPTIADPSAYFQTTLYTGNGSTQSIDQGGNKTFEPDLAWIKNRDAADAHCWFDSVRGVTKLISSDAGTAETTDADTLTAFDSDGFTVGADDKVNTDTEGLVAWQWLESATPGFDIVSFTGNGSNRTISHSLSAVPEFMILKNLDTDIDWSVYHASLGNTHYLGLNSTAVSNDNDTYWNDTTPTSSVFTVGTHNSVNKSSSPMIAYLWAGVESFSKFGSYVGNANTDGPFVWCGFKPAFLMVKEATSVEGWLMFTNTIDTYNVVGDYLLANSNVAEYAASYVDFLSNGFKVRINGSGMNGSTSDTHIFMAWADTPFKTAPAR